MSQSIPTGYIPPGNSLGLAQENYSWGWDLKVARGREFNKGQVLWKMKVKLQKMALIKFLPEETEEKLCRGSR